MFSAVADPEFQAHAKAKGAKDYWIKASVDFEELQSRLLDQVEKLIDGVPGIEKSRLAEMSYWHAVALVNMGKVDDSLPIFKKAFQIEPSWREVTRRLPKSELLPNDDALIQRIVAQ